MVWRVARQSELVVDDMRLDQELGTQPMLDNEYEIRRCEPEPHEDPGSESDRGRSRTAVQLVTTGCVSAPWPS
jgi:hypothetical protein